jgi:hypothetical protein
VINDSIHTAETDINIVLLAAVRIFNSQSLRYFTNYYAPFYVVLPYGAIFKNISPMLYKKLLQTPCSFTRCFNSCIP